MKFSPLPFETVALTGFTHMIQLDYTDLIALGANAAGTIQLFPSTAGKTFPAGLSVQRAALNLTTPFDFSDAAMNSCLIKVGDVGTTDRHLANTQTAVDGAHVDFFVSDKAQYAYVAAGAITATITTAGGGTPTLAEATVGSVQIYLKLVDLNALELDD